MKGYSVIELLGAVTIASLLGMVGYPKLANLTTAYRLQSATRVVAAEMLKTRFRAVAENACLRIAFNSSDRTLQVQRLTSGTCSTTGTFTDDGPPRELDDSKTLTISSTGSPIFTPRGLLVPTTQSTVTLSTSGATRLVAVRLVGGVHVQ